MSFKVLVQKRMFILIIILFMIVSYFGGIPTGYNRTLGWAYDFRYWLFRIIPISWLIYIIGYGILALIKVRTNKIYSTIHLILLISIFVLNDIFNINSQLIILLSLVSFVIFIVNFIWSIRSRKTNKNVEKPAHNNGYN